MASKTAILSVRVVSDVKNATQGLDDVADKATRLEDGLKRAAAPAGIAVAALAGIGKAATDSASELQQSAGAVESVFGGHAAAVQDAARTAASSVGLAASEYQNMSAVLGAQLKNMGTPMEDLAGSTQNLIGLGSDLAATFGGTTADAVSAISALLRGERDPIERYGVSIKQSDINARLAAEGKDKLEGAAKTQAEAQAALALLTEQTASAQGQFARETDTMAGSQQIAAAQFENAKAALGEKLLPVVTAFMEAMSGAAQWVAQNSDALLILGGVVGTIAGVILAANAAMGVWTAVQTTARVATAAWTGVQAAFNAVMALNPITLVVIAIGALVAAVVVAYNKSEAFRNVVSKLWDALKAGGGWVVDHVIKPIGDAFNAVVDAVKSVYDWVKNLFSGFQLPSWLQTVLSWVGLEAPSGPESGAILAATGATDAPLARLASWALAPRTGPGPTPVGGVVNITVNGALDPDAVARQIGRILSRRDLINGTERIVGATL